MSKKGKKGLQIDLCTPQKVATVLAEYNRWRRGEGEYGWDENPQTNNREFPYTPAQLGAAIDEAVDMLLAVGRKQCK